VVAPSVMSAAPPATTSMRRPIRFELIVNLCRTGGSLVLAVGPRRFGRGRRCDHLG
jgi:hypothetical protein